MLTKELDSLEPPAAVDGCAAFATFAALAALAACATLATMAGWDGCAPLDVVLREALAAGWEAGWEAGLETGWETTAFCAGGCAWARYCAIAQPVTPSAVT